MNNPFLESIDYKSVVFSSLLITPYKKYRQEEGQKTKAFKNIFEEKYILTLHTNVSTNIG